MKTSSRLKRAAIAFCVGFLLLVGWIALRWDAPPLRLVRTRTEITVDVQTLGEYQTTVSRIRLSDINQSAVVWELATANGTPQIHEFTLKPGENPALLESSPGTYRVVVPAGGNLFLLEKARKYRIELWGGSTIFTKRSATFEFGS